jgi:hypothetical protein
MTAFEFKTLNAKDAKGAQMTQGINVEILCALCDSFVPFAFK